MEVLCEGACVMNKEGQKPVEIGRLQRYAVDYVFDSNIRLLESGAPLARLEGQIAFTTLARRMPELQFLSDDLQWRETITLPLFAAKVILACARDGQHRGQGRHHPPDSEMDRIAKATVVDYARARWREHGWRHGTKLLAAQEVLHEKRGTKNLARRVNFTAEYLTRLMGPKPEA